MTAAKIILMLLEPFNKVMIARYINLSSVTYFEVGNKAVMQFRSIFTTGIMAIMPEISRLSAVATEFKSAIDNVLKKAMRFVCYLGIPMLIVLFFWAPFLLKMWLSDQYVPEIANVFKIVLIGYLVNLLYVPIFYLFMGLEEVKYCFIYHLAQSVFNVIFIIILINLGIANFYMFVGAYSLAIALSAILSIVLFFIYKKRLVYEN